MNRFLIKMVLLMFVLIANAFASAPDPLAHWSFRGNGGVIYDETGNGSVGTATGYSAPPWVNAVVGRGIYTGGTNKTQYVTVADSGVLNNLDEFSLSAWIKPSQYRTYNVILAKVTPGRDFVLMLDRYGHFNAHYTSSGLYENCTTSESIPMDTWTHVAATLHETTSPNEDAPSQKVWTLYINGKYQKQCTKRVGASPEWTGSRITIGNLYYRAPYAFPGQIDEVKVFARTLTHNEILREVNNGGSYDLDVDRSLIIHDDNLDNPYARFSLRNIMNEIASSIRLETTDTTATGTSLFSQMWETLLDPQDTSVVWHDCTDLFNGKSIECRPKEGVQAFEGSAVFSRYKALALVNRFDLRDQSSAYADCGEARLVYGFPGPIRTFDRNFIIFESVIKNPLPGNPEGCIPVAEFWASLTDISEGTPRISKVRDFYYNGIPDHDVEPVINYKNFLANTGQIRTNMFMDAGGGATNDWLLKEFKIQFSDDKAYINPVSVKSNPIAQKFSVSLGATSPWWYLGNLDTLVSDTDSFFLKVDDDSWNNGQSHANGDTDENNFTSQTGASFRGVIAGELASLESALTVDQVLNRTEAMTCGGCHNPSAFGLRNANSVGRGKRWPNASFVHVDENRSISSALETTFLPARKADLEYFLNQVEAQAGSGDKKSTSTDLKLDKVPIVTTGKRSG